MRWLAVTFALLGATVALVGGVYLRDRDTSDWLPPGRLVAHHDAMSIAAEMGGTCPRDCDVRVLGHPRADHWTERITIRTMTACVDIDVRTFATRTELSGVTRIACR
jgi:hypothetical protein